MKKRSEILYGSENALERGAEFMHNVKSKMDITIDIKGPSIIVRVPQYRQGFLGILQRGGTIRCITEVTPENLGDCKELQNLVTELRHLDGMKGGIAVNGFEYMATTVLKEAKPLTEVIYSNAEEVVDQGQYIFDTMWKNSIPATTKIREIEGSKQPEYSTQIWNRSDGTLNESKLAELFYDANEIDIVTSTEGLVRGYDFFQELMRPKRSEQKAITQKRFRILIEVSKDNVGLIKRCIDSNIEVKHLKKEPPIYFAVTDVNMVATIEKMEHENMTESILYSNDPLYVERFEIMFERLWNESRSAEEIISLVENDEEVPVLETIESSRKTLSLIKEMISSANDEILGVLPTFDAFQRQVNAGTFEHIIETAHRKKPVIKILVTDKIELPVGESDIKIGNNSKNQISLRRKGTEDATGGGTSNSSSNSDSKVNEFTINSIEDLTIRSINIKSISPQMGMVIVDRTKSIMVEPKKSASTDPLDHIGMSSYSNSLQISKSFGTIFDILWNYSKIFNLIEKSHERLKIQEKMQREFIDIVAHELRTPLQSILGLTDIVKSRTKEKENKDLLETVTENGSRLHKFIENILTATKLEGSFSNIPREVFDLNSLIKQIVDEYEKRFQNREKYSIPHIKEIKFECKGLDEEHKVKANKLQISIVLTNIIDNAINFIPSDQKGLISITVEKKGNDVIVQVKDNGEGIHPEILPRLFTKFATKSFYGSGLGLYNCRKIVHSNYGGIWAENNPKNEKGAVLSFSLPLIV